MSESKLPGEFALIERYFKPLASAMPAALGLGDDAAILDPPAGFSLVATCDAIIAGVHFLAEDPPDRIARKLLRVNLSDLAAKGARPLGYLMTAALNETIDEGWLSSFVAGLGADQAEFGIGLLGGDTVRTSGPVALSLTALGTVPREKALLRSGAKAEDTIYVSGTIGDSALGLAVLTGRLTGLEEAELRYLTDRYHLPQPRLRLGHALIGIGHGALDVSDGLVADLGHLAESSRLGAAIEVSKTPLSPAARRALDLKLTDYAALVTGGDDYEILFTAPNLSKQRIEDLAGELGIAVTPIGRMTREPGVTVSEAGRQMILPRRGFTHF